MRSPRLRPLLARARFACLAALFATTGALRAVDEPVSVFSEIFNGYARTRFPDHSFKPETYVFGEGGAWTRPAKDSAMEQMTFLQVASAVAPTLARLNYRPASKSADTQLLILVFWGATQGSREYDPSYATDRLATATAAYLRAEGKTPETRSWNQAEPAADANAATEIDAAMIELSLANGARDQLDAHNARILGYSEVLERAHFAKHMSFAQDLLTEIGDNRYYVVLQAYDFPTARNYKKLKPLWTARISVAASGHTFASVLDPMLAKAAQFIGRDSGGLKRHVVREGRVDLGPSQVLETLPQK